VCPGRNTDARKGDGELSGTRAHDLQDGCRARRASCSGRNTDAAGGDGAQIGAPALFGATVLDTAFFVPAGANSRD
jgi:hypothetical protein